MLKYMVLSLSLIAPLGVNAMGCFGWCKKPSNRIMPVESLDLVVSSPAVESLDPVVVSPALATGRPDTGHAIREIAIQELRGIRDLAQASAELAAETEMDRRLDVTAFVLEHQGNQYSPRTLEVLVEIRRKLDQNQARAGREADRFEEAERVARARISELRKRNSII